MPRRGANIYKRKDGRWEGRIRKEGACCGRKYVSVYGKTYAEVKDKMERMQELPKAASGEGGISMREAVNIWLRERSSHWKQSTFAAYSNIARKHIIPGLGDMPVGCITGDVMERFLGRARQGDGIGKLSNRYLRNICGVAIRAINYVKKKYCLKMEIPENQVPAARQGEMVLPKEKDLAVLEKHLVEHSGDGTCLGVLVAFYMGLRIGEVCALTWADISLSEKTICVRKSLQRTKAADGQKNNTEILLQAPKTSSSQRIIPIPPVLLPLLEAHRREKEQYVIKGVKKPWAEPRTLQYRFAKILERCGIERFNFHMLRHAFATRCIAWGFDVKSLSEILGHSNIQVTLNLYVHSDMRRKKELMAQFDSYFHEVCAGAVS